MKFTVAVVALIASASALSTSDRKTVLSMHNDYRERIANGQETTYNRNKAADMTKLKYDTAVEKVMADYLKSCNYAHNSNRGAQVSAADTYADTSSCSYNSCAGENLYWTSSTSQSDEYYIKQATKLWYDEVTDTGYTYREYTGSAADYDNGHFTQIIWADTRYIGCAVQRCSGFTLAGCNYVGAGNTRGQYPYTQSSSAASDCPTDMSTNNNGLCDGCGNKNYYACDNVYSNCDTDLAPYCNDAYNSWVAEYCKTTCGTDGCGSLSSESSCNDGTS